MERTTRVAKLLVLGDSGVGKTSFIDRLNFEGCNEEGGGGVGGRAFFEDSDLGLAGWRGGGEHSKVLQEDLDFKVTSKRMDITKEMVEDEGDLSEAGEEMPEEVELRFWDVNPLLCGGGAISSRQVEVFRNTTCTLILFDITSLNSYKAAKEKYYTQSRKISPEGRSEGARGG
jgi:GTPase SAR1 family protein